MAGQYSAALLQLSHYGRAWHDLHRPHARRSIFTLAREAGAVALDAMALDAQFSISLHRQHRRLDDSGIGAATLAGLWVDAHGSRSFDARFGGQRVVHAARFYGNVHGAFDALPVFDVARNGAWAAASQWPRGTP